MGWWRGFMAGVVTVLIGGAGGFATPATAAVVPPAAVVTEAAVVPEAAVVARAAATVHTGGSPLNVRNNASLWNPPVDRIADGRRVRPRCQLGGDPVAGTVRTSSTWVDLGGGRFLSDAYLRWGSRPDLPWCNQPKVDVPAAQSTFIRFAARRAAASWRDHRVPISVSVAQAINESGWGRSSLTAQGNAFFGIKCFGTPGPIAAGCRPYRTSECGQYGCGPTIATFRVYRAASRSFLDHGRFLAVNPRYRSAFDHTGDPDRFAREIHKAGYATDPDYSDKLIALMHKYDLYRLDR